MRFFWLCLMGALLMPAVAQARTMAPYRTAVIRLLDKATARVEQAELELNQPYQFGAMQVEMRSCQQTPPEEEPESAAWLVATEKKQDKEEALLFRGWMFASNPALSALEHPFYDVWVVSCKNAINAPETAPAGVNPAGQDGALPVPLPGYVPAEAVPAADPTTTAPFSPR